MPRTIRWVPATGMKQDQSGRDNLVWVVKRTLGERMRVATEYEFAKELGREFRWDIALWPSHTLLLGIEVNGGIWKRGAHGSPTDILRNMEKLNLATALGWVSLAFTPDEAKSGYALAFIEATIERLTCKTPTTVPLPSRPRKSGSARLGARSRRSPSSPRSRSSSSGSAT